MAPAATTIGAILPFVGANGANGTVQFYLTLLPKFSLKFNRVQYQLILIYITWDKETYLFTIFPLALNYEFQAIDHLTNESKNWDDIILLTCKLIVPLPISIM